MVTLMRFSLVPTDVYRDYSIWLRKLRKWWRVRYRIFQSYCVRDNQPIQPLSLMIARKVLESGSQILPNIYSSIIRIVW